MKAAPALRLCLAAAGGAALFAAGWFAGHRQATAVAAPSSVRRSTAATATTARPGGANVASPAEHLTTRPGSALPPFRRGAAKEWLLALVERVNLGGDDESVAIEAMQVFMSLDKAEVLECREAIAAIIAERPDGKGFIDERAIALVFLNYRWAQLDPAAALDALAAAGAPEQPEEEKTAEHLFSRMARSDPAAAEAAIARLPERLRDKALESVIRSVGHQDVRAALDLAARHPAESGRDAATQVLVEHVAKHPAEAATLAAGSTDRLGAVSLARVMTEWATKDVDAADAWSSTMQGPGREAARAAVLSARADADKPTPAMLTEAAGLAAATSSASLEHLDALQRSVAGSLIKHDSRDAALAWVDSLPAGANRTGAVAIIAENWIRSDPTAASEWVRSLTTPAEHDAAAGPLIESVRESDPAAAFAWAASLHEPELRRSTLDSVFRNWQSADRAAAEAARAALPEADPLRSGR